jgi:hypothetical protein
LSSAGHRELLSGEQDEAGALQVRVRPRIDAVVVVGDGDEGVAVLAIPANHLGGRCVAVALGRVRVEVALVEGVDIDALREDPRRGRRERRSWSARGLRP